MKINHLIPEFDPLRPYFPFLLLLLMVALHHKFFFMKIEMLTKEDLLEVLQKLDNITETLLELTLSKAREKVYSNEQLSSLLGVSRRTLQNWRDKGLIEYTQINRKIYYTQEQIDTFLINNNQYKF